MSFSLYFVLIGLTFVITLMLIVIILLQQSKSGGGLGFLSGGATEAFLGANASNVLTKSTAWMLVIFLMLTLTLAWGASRLKENRLQSIADEAATPAAVQLGKKPLPATPDTQKPSVPVAPEAPKTPAPAAPSAPTPVVKTAPDTPAPVVPATPPPAIP